MASGAAARTTHATTSTSRTHTIPYGTTTRRNTNRRKNDDEKKKKSRVKRRKRRSVLESVVIGGVVFVKSLGMDHGEEEEKVVGYAATMMTTRGTDRRLVDVFNAAASAKDYTTADRLWTEAIEITGGKLATAWSNRGVRRLQENMWQSALSDLEEAKRLEEEQSDKKDARQCRFGGQDESGASAYVLNLIGNCLGGLNRWREAISMYQQAAERCDAEGITEIARLNEALAYFQIGEDEVAIQRAKSVVRRDSFFWDARVALCVFLWASGAEENAEEEWLRLCENEKWIDGAIDLRTKTLEGIERGQGRDENGQRVRTFGTQRRNQMSPCALYTSTAIVANRWPPRCTAGLDAFLSVSRAGRALDYDGLIKTYAF